MLAWGLCLDLDFCLDFVFMLGLRSVACETNTLWDLGGCRQRHSTNSTHPTVPGGGGAKDYDESCDTNS
jgi:hypothetical protein